jgi:hypothetical protein
VFTFSLPNPLEDIHKDQRDRHVTVKPQLIWALRKRFDAVKVSARERLMLLALTDAGCRSWIGRYGYHLYSIWPRLRSTTRQVRRWPAQVQTHPISSTSHQGRRQRVRGFCGGPSRCEAHTDLVRGQDTRGRPFPPAASLPEV